MRFAFSLATNDMFPRTCYSYSLVKCLERPSESEWMREMDRGFMLLFVEGITRNLGNPQRDGGSSMKSAAFPLKNQDTQDILEFEDVEQMVLGSVSLLRFMWIPMVFYTTFSSVMVCGTSLAFVGLLSHYNDFNGLSWGDGQESSLPLVLRGKKAIKDIKEFLVGSLQNVAPEIMVQSRSLGWNQLIYVSHRRRCWIRVVRPGTLIECVKGR